MSPSWRGGAAQEATERGRRMSGRPAAGAATRQARKPPPPPYSVRLDTVARAAPFLSATFATDAHRKRARRMAGRTYRYSMTPEIVGQRERPSGSVLDAVCMRDCCGSKDNLP